MSQSSGEPDSKRRSNGNSYKLIVHLLLTKLKEFLDKDESEIRISYPRMADKKSFYKLFFSIVHETYSTKTHITKEDLE